MFKVVALAAMLMAGAAAGPALLPASPAQPREVLKWSAKIDVPGGSGSGTVIGNVRFSIAGKPQTFSLVLTCAHVVTQDFQKPVWRHPKVDYLGHTYRGTVVATDAKLDLSLIMVRQHWGPAPLYWGHVIPGDPELISGAPMGTNIALTQGAVVGKVPHSVHGLSGWQGSAPAYPGNSGGGAYVYRGGWRLAGVLQAVLGVHSGPHAPTQLFPDISYFIPMTVVRKFLAENRFVGLKS